jgi:hypothetical protein
MSKSSEGTSDCDLDHYVIIMKLLEFVPIHNLNQSCHIKDLIKLKGPFFQKVKTLVIKKINE